MSHASQINCTDWVQRTTICDLKGVLYGIQFVTISMIFVVSVHLNHIQKALVIRWRSNFFFCLFETIDFFSRMQNVFLSICFRDDGYILTRVHNVNTLMPRQKGRHFPDGVFFKCIFLNENVWISVLISLKFVIKGPINNIPALVQIMAWCPSGYKPLSEHEPSLLMHMCVTRPQWVMHRCRFVIPV